MKPIHYIIAASLILNAALIIYTKPFAPRAPASPTAAQAQKPDAQTARAPNLQTATPEQLMKKLAALDFPPDIIKAIISGRILSDVYDNKQLAILGYDARRYWQKGYGLGIMAGHAKWTEIAHLQWDATNTLLKLFGTTLEDDERRQPENLRQRYGDLPDAKLQALVEISDQHYKQYAALGVAGGTGDQWKAIFLHQREDIAKALTPDELFEYDLRNGAASHHLGNDTKLFDITEQEFRDLLPVYQKGYKNDNTLTLTPPSDFSSEAERDSYKQEQIQQILGPDRYADFQQATDPAYEKLNLIVQRLDLPLSAAREVVTVQTDLTHRAAAIDADPALTATERAANYNALAQEAKTRITQTLGARGYTAYRDNSQNWIQTLESGKPPPTPPPAK